MGNICNTPLPSCISERDFFQRKQYSTWLKSNHEILNKKKDFDGNVDMTAVNNIITSDDTTTNKSLYSSNDMEDVNNLSHFTLHKSILGLGGFGMVRICMKVTNNGYNDRGTIYAMKSLAKASIIKRANGVRAVFSELMILSRLSITSKSPFICSISYAFQDNIYLYMIVDACLGGDLRYNLRRMKNYHFSEVQAQFYISQILIAVQFCHGKNVLHRDIKPENIFLTYSGYLKLGDFGVSKIIDQTGVCYSSSGTHGYLAPEVYSHESKHMHGVGIDYFAIGVCLHEFLCGRRPFEASRLQNFKNPRHSDLLQPSYLISKANISNNSKDIVKKLLHVTSDGRLGCKHGLSEVKVHPWFHSFDWKGVEEESLAAPYIPDCSFIRSDLNGTSIQVAMEEHLNAPEIRPVDDSQFQNFSLKKVSEMNSATYVSTTKVVTTGLTINVDGKKNRVGDAASKAISRSNNNLRKYKNVLSSSSVINSTNSENNNRSHSNSTSNEYKSDHQHSQQERHSPKKSNSKEANSPTKGNFDI